MRIKDILPVVRGSTLRSFPWGDEVASAVNVFVAPLHRITLDSTGEDVDAALATLASDRRDMVESIEIHLVSHAETPTEEAPAKDPKGSVAIALSVGLLIITALLAWTMVTRKEGQGEVDAGVISSLVSGLVEVIKVFVTM